MNPTFSETQRFNQWWHYLLLAIPFLTIGVVTIIFYTGVIPSKNDSENGIIGLWISLGISFLFFIWFIFMKLKTTINETGITVHFIGIPFCKRQISWAEIQSIAVTEYSPIYDYGGWGVRYSLSGNGWCYNVSGKMGIKLQLTNGKPFLIGTQKTEEAQAIINHYFKK